MAKTLKEDSMKYLYFDTINLYEKLLILVKYDGVTLNEIVSNEIVKELIKRSIYKPTKISDTVKTKWKNEDELTDSETEKIFNDNPQSHKEAGFNKGWASRFDTWFKIAKELGLVYYLQNERIEFSESGKMLLDKENPQNEQLVFANAFAKYQRHNPFRRVLNDNVPLILLIETIKILNQDSEYNGAGISKKELPILLCWRNNNAKELYEKIKEVRQEFGFTPSDETILDICYNLLDETKRDHKSILVDYPDDFIRKMRLTGLISIRGGGRFLDTNSKENDAIEFILKNYSKYKAFVTERDFFNYISEIDKELISKLTVFKAPIRATTNELNKWVEFYQWEILKREMLNLAYNKPSKDEILKIIDRPLRLEFLTSLAVLSKIPNIEVKPNFISDDEGLPSSFASGGNPDIECLENGQTILIEVTLLTGTQQHIRESQSIRRHLEDFVIKGVNAFSLFVSPKVFVDTCRNADFIKFQYSLEIRILDIELFLKQLEKYSTLRQVAYEASSCL